MRQKTVIIVVVYSISIFGLLVAHHAWRDWYLTVPQYRASLAECGTKPVVGYDNPLDIKSKKRYVSPTSEAYDGTIMHAGSRYFCSENEAQSEGYVNETLFEDR